MPADVSRFVWNAAVDAAVDAAVGELLAEFPGSQVSMRELSDDRGVVSIAVTVGDGRLITAARTVDLAPVVWPWPLDRVVGVWPPREFPTVGEFIGSLVAVTG
jgi:hypothetical protein